jgi:hypothetical protein
MSTQGQDFANIYGRELDRLANEIGAYPSDADLWSTTGAQKNPPGSLALHVVGGLEWFIGAELGKSGYVRNREREFADRGAPRDEVVRRIRACRATIVPILERLGDDDIAQPYPGTLPPAFAGMTTRAFLMQLLWHLGWHAGHVYYHRLGIAEPVKA